jgi:hypothetical protein
MRNIFYVALLIMTIVGAYFVLINTTLADLFTDLDLLVIRVRELGILGPLLIIGLMVLAIVFNPLPSAPIALAAGAVYGHVVGTIYIVAESGFKNSHLGQLSNSCSSSKHNQGGAYMLSIKGITGPARLLPGTVAMAAWEGDLEIEEASSLAGKVDGEYTDVYFIFASLYGVWRF